jgi:hypothetical protein
MSAKVAPAGSIEPTEMAAYGALRPVADHAAYGRRCPTADLRGSADKRPPRVETSPCSLAPVIVPVSNLW